jgi:putative Mg2+ transporter-C (MgtC) family protein
MVVADLGIDAAALLACAVSLLIGGAVGIEREWRGQSAGIRTHLLVALSSTLLMVAAGRQGQWYMFGLAGQQVVSDPARMAHGVLTGIGFLCAGTIFRERFSIHGLTTAASLWFTSALGLLAGMGLTALALCGLVLVVTILAVLRLGVAYLPSRLSCDIELRTGPAGPDGAAIARVLARNGLTIRHQSIAIAQDEIRRRLTVAGSVRTDIERLARALRTEDGVRSVNVRPRR